MIHSKQFDFKSANLLCNRKVNRTDVHDIYTEIPQTRNLFHGNTQSNYFT